MSELWAKFDLNLYDVSEPYSANLTPLDDKASIVQTIDGQTYLISISSTLTDGGSHPYLPGSLIPTNGEGATNFGPWFSPSGEDDRIFHFTWSPATTSAVVPQSYDVTQRNNVTPTLVNYQSFPN